MLLIVAVVAAFVSQRRAGLRHFLWALGVGQVALLTALLPLLPSWHTKLLPVGILRARSFVDLALAATGGASAPFVAASDAAARTAGVSPPGASSAPSLSILLLALWLAGTLVLLLRQLGSWRAARAQIRAAVPVDDLQLLACLAERGNALGLRQPPAVRLSSRISVPVVARILRPVLLLPADAPSWPTSLQRSVFTHELAHVRRKDLAIQLLADLVRAVHWPNPLVWIAAARLLIERERAADDCVLAGGAKESDYAGHLLTLAQAGRGQPVLVAGASMVGRSQLRQRLERMLRRPFVAGRDASLGVLRRRTAIALTLVAVVAAVPMACLDGARRPTGPATRLTYRVDADRLEDTAAVLTRRLDMLGLDGAQVIRGAGLLTVDVPALPSDRRAEVKRILAASGRLRIVLVDSEAAYNRQLADLVRGDAAAAAAGITVNQDMWKLQDGTEVRESFLEGSHDALARYLSRLPEALPVPADHQVVLDRKYQPDRHRTLYLDHGRSVEIRRVVGATVFRQPGRDDDWFEVNVELDQVLGAQLDQLTRSHVGHKVALLFDEDDLWGAPVINMPFGTRVSVTARGSRAEAEQLAAGFRAGGLPARLELLTEDLVGPAGPAEGQPRQR